MAMIFFQIQVVRAANQVSLTRRSGGWWRAQTIVHMYMMHEWRVLNIWFNLRSTGLGLGKAYSIFMLFMLFNAIYYTSNCSNKIK